MIIGVRMRRNGSVFRRTRVALCEIDVGGHSGKW